MADYVALEDDHSPHNQPPPPALAIPPHHPPAHQPHQPQHAIPIPDDPSNIPLSPSPPQPPLHPHAVLSRLFNFSGRTSCNRIVLYCYPLLLLLLAAFILTVGLQERSTANSDSSQLSLWLIVSAMLVGCMSVMLFTLFTLLSFSTSSAPLLLPLLFCSFLLHLLFTFVWFVIGNVWFTLAHLPGTTDSAPSWRLLRTVYYVLLLGYAQLAVEVSVGVVGWSVRHGCMCIKRSEEGARMEAERRRLVRGEGRGGVMGVDAAIGGVGGLANGGAQFI